MSESRPPVLPPSLDLRSWFAGCALANGSLVNTTNPEVAIKIAFDYADRMLSALRTQPAPGQETFPAPTDSEFKRWENKIEVGKLRDAKTTAPAIRRAQTVAFGNSIPDPNAVGAPPSNPGVVRQPSVQPTNPMSGPPPILSSSPPTSPIKGPGCYSVSPGSAEE